jgi:dihydroorotate dehydrogenase (NAD+) catalytic subunit
MTPAPALTTEIRDPEKGNPGRRSPVKPGPDQRGPDMRVKMLGLEFRNPVLAASGTFGYGTEFADILTLDSLGGVITKGLSREPMLGNSAPRMVETAAGMLNAIGLQNMGVAAFVQERLPMLQDMTSGHIVVNVFGFTVEDYVAVIEQLNQAKGIAAYELNVSCPNTRHGGMVFGTDPQLLEEIVASARKASARPLIVKLSPNVTSIAQMAQVAQNAGADAVSVANTFLGMAIDAETRRPRLNNVTGGLSGPAIKPLALRLVMESARAVSIPVIGIGGIVRAEDAVEFLLAGATAVQVGTASYADPRATENIARGLKAWCVKHHVAKISELTGGLLTEKS